MGKENSSLLNDYGQWLIEIKDWVLAARQRAALAVSAELISLYWYVGQDILQWQAAQGWGSKMIEWLGRDLHEFFSEMKGFFCVNLLYVRDFTEARPDFEIAQQPVGQSPWFHISNFANQAANG